MFLTRHGKIMFTCHSRYYTVSFNAGGIYIYCAEYFTNPSFPVTSSPTPTTPVRASKHRYKSFAKNGFSSAMVPRKVKLEITYNRASRHRHPEAYFKERELLSLRNGMVGLLSHCSAPRWLVSIVVFCAILSGSWSDRVESTIDVDWFPRMPRSKIAQLLSLSLFCRNALVKESNAENRETVVAAPQLWINLPSVIGDSKLGRYGQCLLIYEIHRTR